MTSLTLAASMAWRIVTMHLCDDGSTPSPSLAAVATLVLTQGKPMAASRRRNPHTL